MIFQGCEHAETKSKMGRLGNPKADPIGPTPLGGGGRFGGPRLDGPWNDQSIRLSGALALRGSPSCDQGPGLG